MKAYEIHTFFNGVWKIDSVFDDRQLALHEATKIDEGSRYAGVRVIEETYDETSDLTTTRTIFRGSRSAEKRSRAAPAKPQKKKPVNHGPRGSGDKTRRSRPPPPEKKKNGVIVPILILLIILFGGVVAMLLLRQMA